MVLCSTVSPDFVRQLEARLAGQRFGPPLLSIYIYVYMNFVVFY